MELLEVDKLVSTFTHSIKEHYFPYFLRRYQTKEEYQEMKKKESIVALQKLCNKLIKLSLYFKSIKN
ncbi:hypothetical protein CHH48_10015 [Terribacillus saccharophilus]|uniref:Uncharacterized protein n=1 Tax=Terribacillus saccharophilus TaxID=361277 RepID=A0ABX4GY79_9BACI|nr:hypothetical protein CHH50_09110 [Terribacillus saccharophilus]PAD99836.1 hypothetical protein CHH48_10015 [Terribacillus saccharophilus]